LKCHAKSFSHETRLGQNSGTLELTHWACRMTII